MSSRVLLLFGTVLLLLVWQSVGTAQTPQPPDSQPPSQPPAEKPADETHQHHQPTTAVVAIPHEREGSGTAWLPDATPMYAIHGSPIGAWDTMLHGVGILQYIHDAKPRGHRQFGSVNWAMGHARRQGSFGEFALRGMVSLEPITIRGCGYPDLLASGEVCDSHAIVDKQHPHDLLMEVAALYSRPLSEGLGLQIYGALAGEPALGPVAFPHRISAMMNPIAPISHHWLDATHVAFGVLTSGVYGQRWKVEGSLFNGREPDENRYDVNLAALDSYSARATVLPTARWSLQVSAGHLSEAEEHGIARVDVNRVTASAIHHRPRDNGGLLATTLAWGRNVEGGLGTNAVLLESTLSIADRHVTFGRAELVQKTAHDLDLHSEAGEVFRIGKVQGGYSRFFDPVVGWRPGVGATLSLSIVPERLAETYGRRASGGFAVFLTLRPAAMIMSTKASP